MLIIGIDTTAVTATVAVADIEVDGVKTYTLFSSKTKLTHSEKLMPMLDAVLKLQGKSIGDVRLVAVNVGPGSFTGVRIGVATAKGLADGLGVPCAPVNTLDSLCENLSGVSGIICPVMDARRDQFYNALYKNGRRIIEPRAVSAEELSAQLESVSGSVYICGDGAKLFSSLYSGRKKLHMAAPAAVDQNGLSVAVCGFKAFACNTTVSAAELKPLYLRMSQAERMRNEK